MIFAYKTLYPQDRNIGDTGKSYFLDFWAVCHLLTTVLYFFVLKKYFVVRLLLFISGKLSLSMLLVEEIPGYYLNMSSYDSDGIIFSIKMGKVDQCLF